MRNTHGNHDIHESEVMNDTLPFVTDKVRFGYDVYIWNL